MSDFEYLYGFLANSSSIIEEYTFMAVLVQPLTIVGVSSKIVNSYKTSKKHASKLVLSNPC
jgi:uncharacterized protein YybS (DUF2232 family)